MIPDKEKNGLQQLIDFLERCGLQDEAIHGVRISDGEVGFLSDADLGLFLWAEAVPILERHSIYRTHFGEGNWDLPPCMVMIWLDSVIIVSHEYDSALDFRRIDRNPS